VTRPDVSAGLGVQVSAPANVVPGGSIDYAYTLTNNSAYALNAVQVVATLPAGLEFDDEATDRVTLHSRDIVVLTVGRLVPGETHTMRFQARAAEGQATGTTITVGGLVRSSTARPVTVPAVSTVIGQ
jgi:uncharacterized repeat protein (TIGR01451 family)